MVLKSEESDAAGQAEALRADCGMVWFQAMGGAVDGGRGGARAGGGGLTLTGV